MSPPVRPEFVRFWEKVNIPSDGEGCWLWVASPNKEYGRFVTRDHRTVLAHRWVWQYWYGAIPKGMFVCHRCDVPKCVNVLHLFLGTPADNMADRDRKGRQSHGTNHYKAKLTEQDVRDIRASGKSLHQLARDFGVDRSTIQAAKRGESWRHLD